jgi:O-acetylserine/cysteine efflux transporter
LVVVVAWGLNFVVMKIGLRELTPFQLGLARYVFAAMPLVLLVRPPALPWRFVAGFGLLQGVGQFGFLFVALNVGMTAALASVLMQTQVFFTALLAALWLGERPGRPLQVGLVLAAAALVCFGIGVQSGAGVAAASRITALGLALNLLAALMWAASNIVARRAQAHAAAHTPSGRYDPIAFVGWSSVAPIVPFAILTVSVDGWAAQTAWMQASWHAWAVAAYLGWVATLLGYALWTGLLSRHSANRVAPFSLGVPVVGLLAGLLLLGEVITPWQWAGAALVGLALLVVMFGGHWARRR